MTKTELKDIKSPTSAASAALKRFRLAQRELYRTARNYAWSMPGTGGRIAEHETISKNEDFQDRLQDAAIEFAFAAAEFAESAIGGKP